MVKAGLVDEVYSLYHRTPPLSVQAKDAVGYTELIAYFEGKWDLETAIEKIKVNTRRLGKHQRTWLRRMSHIRWFDISPEIRLGKWDELTSETEQWLVNSLRD